MSLHVVLASHNAGKLKELQALFAPLGWTLHLVSEFGADAPDETESTFAGNALLKARHAARLSGLPALADDSGLCVDALHGAPGVDSAYFAGNPCNDSANNQKLLLALRDVADAQRTAQFVCTMAYVRRDDDAQPTLVEARWHGRILRAPRGQNGFGYDPLFFVPTHDCSSAELTPDVKNKISHRGQAAALLLEKLRG